jgi:hypothetical protein
VVCRARADELDAPFCARTAERHPGGGDARFVEELKPSHLAASREPLAIGGALWELDTTDWGTEDLNSLNTAISTALARSTG